MIVGARTAADSIQVVSKITTGASGSVAHATHRMVFAAHRTPAINIHNIPRGAGHALERAASNAHGIERGTAYACENRARKGQVPIHCT